MVYANVTPSASILNDANPRPYIELTDDHVKHMV
jgi:hypothetical protein